MLSCIAIVWAVPAVAVTVDDQYRPIQVPQWRTIGANPCRGNAECTTEWALERSVFTHVFPERIADDFRRQLAAGVSGVPSQICRGERFFMSFGREGTPVFVPHMQAAFTDVLCTETIEWTSYDPVTDRFYRFFIVEACGNIGGGIVDTWGLYTPVPIAPVVTPSYMPSAVTSVTNGWTSSTPFIGSCCFGSSTGFYDEDDVVVWWPKPDPDSETDPEKSPVVPLPASLLLLLTGLSSLFVIRRTV